MTTLDFNSVPSDPYSNKGVDAEVARIKTLIAAIGNYGVDKKYLFTVEELHQGKHIPKVVRCLEEIEKLVRYFKKCDKISLNVLLLPKVCRKMYSSLMR